MAHNETDSNFRNSTIKTPFYKASIYTSRSPFNKPSPQRRTHRSLPFHSTTEGTPPSSPNQFRSGTSPPCPSSPGFWWSCPCVCRSCWCRSAGRCRPVLLSCRRWSGPAGSTGGISACRAFCWWWYGGKLMWHWYGGVCMCYHQLGLSWWINKLAHGAWRGYRCGFWWQSCRYNRAEFGENDFFLIGAQMYMPFVENLMKLVIDFKVATLIVLVLKWINRKHFQ